MNQNNIGCLCGQLKFTGFGENFEDKVSENISKQTPGFTLTHSTRFGGDTVDSELHFKKSARTDMYFFNSYRVDVRKEDSPESMRQTFHISKVGNITLKEAYNLLSGRAVNKDLIDKEGRFYNAWLQMDFTQTDRGGNFKIKQFHQNYGFDLEKELSRHPIKELAGDMERSNLVQSLRKGNRTPVTFVQDGGEHKRFIEANPRFKTLDIHDGDPKQLGARQNKQERQLQNAGTSGRAARQAGLPTRRFRTSRPQGKEPTDKAVRSVEKVSKTSQSRRIP